MAEDNPQNLVLSTEDLQAIIVGVASSETLVTGIANHLRPRLESLNTHLATQEGAHQRIPQQQGSQTNNPWQEGPSNNHLVSPPTDQGNSRVAHVRDSTAPNPAGHGSGTGQSSRAAQGKKRYTTSTLK